MDGAPEAGSWSVLAEAGTASALHEASARSIGGGFLPVRTLKVLDVISPALVLGSAQPDSDVDREALASAGVELARRRSGGGAVFIAPREVLWLDVVIPYGDLLWDHDVGRAAWWLGAAWARSLAALGVADARVWTGPMQRSRWSDKICFGGVGPGEVLTPRGKVVGISQRRTRWGVVFQCAALLTWDPGVVPGLLRLPAHERAEAALDLAGAADPVGEGRGADLLAALVAALVT